MLEDRNFAGVSIDPPVLPRITMIVFSGSLTKRHGSTDFRRELDNDPGALTSKDSQTTFLATLDTRNLTGDGSWLLSAPAICKGYVCFLFQTKIMAALIIQEALIRFRKQ